MPRKSVVPAAVAAALTAAKDPPAVPDKPSAVARAVSVLSGDSPDEIATKDVDTLTAEILALQIQGNRVLLAIGRRLIAAKSKLSHGDWLPWLDSVNIPERLAQRYMKLAREWTANPSILSDLGMSKALALLALPDDERDAFLAEGHVVNGEEKSVIDMTAKELAEAIKARQDAETTLFSVRQQLEESERRRAEAEADAEKEYLAAQDSARRLMIETSDKQAALANLKAEHEKLISISDELEALKKKPVDVAIETVRDEAAIEAARREVREQMQADLDFARADADTARQALENAKTSAQQAIDEANADAKKAVENLAEASAAARQAALDAEKYRQELERLKTANANAAPFCDTEMEFLYFFRHAKDDINHMALALANIKNENHKKAFRESLLALSDAIRKAAE